MLCLTKLFPALGSKLRESKRLRRNFLVKIFLSLFLFFSFFFFVNSSVYAADWYNSGWSYRKSITVDKTKVPNTDQINFPVLISLTIPDFKDATNNGKVGQADGGDILFTGSDGTTKLSHEIETYNNSTGELVAWVKIPTLSTSTNTVIYIYYGNVSVDNQWVTDGSVWDSNFTMVQHLGDATTSTTSDSTTNSNTGNKKGAAEPAVSSSGNSGSAQNFDGSDDYINVGSKSNLNITNALTIEAWVKPNSGYGETSPRIFDKSKYSMSITASSGILTFTAVVGTANKNLSATGAISTTGWTYVVATFDNALGSSQQKIFTNGSLNNQRDQVGPIDDSSANIGYIGDIGNTLRAYSGLIDEVRISNVARSTDWITTTYNNQSNPSAFYYIGTLECYTTCSTPTNIYHILLTGQSLALGARGTPALTTTQPYTNKMLNGNFFTPLIESTNETISSAMSNTITSLNSGNYQTAVTNNALSGATYLQLKKGTTPYNTGLDNTTKVGYAADALNMNDKVIAVATIHGEADRQAASGVYKDYLVEWQNDYNTDLKAITGQTENIPMFTDQMGSYTVVSATSQVPLDQLAASEENPTKIYLVGPKYFLTYSSDDGVHLTNTSYRWLGEYYGKVIKKVMVDGQSWAPLSPSQIVRNGNVIYAKFNVPTSPIVFDTTNVLSKTNYGFEYTDDGSPPSISSVEIFDSQTVKITLSGTPAGSNQKLGYAYTGTIGSFAGSNQAGSARGNLRDSDSTSSLYGNNLYNWAVTFNKSVTADSTAPVISSVSSAPSTTTSTITWTTNESSSSKVDYGITDAYGSTTTESDTPSTVTSHSVALSGLSSCTTYHYRVRSKDLAQNEAVGSDNTFTTSGCTVSTTVSSSSNNSSSTSAPGCGDQTPGSKVPWLYGAIPQDSDSILLYFTEADDPVDSYALEFGTKPGEYQWGATNIGKKGSRTYLVKSLSPNKTYYFRVRGGNGCATGSWSNEISAKTRDSLSFNQLNNIQLELKPVEETPEEGTCQIYTVETGDTLWSIAGNLLGGGNKYKEIVEQNKNNYSSLETSSNLRVGWELKINCGKETKEEIKKTAETSAQGSYDVKVKVIDTNKKPVEGAKVTIHSKVQETTTDKNGIAQFNSVEPGQHKILIAYSGYSGEQSVNLTGDVKEFNFNIQVKQTNAFLNPQVIAVIGVLILALVSTVIFLLRAKKRVS